VSEDRKTEGLALGLSIADNVTLSNPRGLGPFGLVLPNRQDEATKPYRQEDVDQMRSPRQPVGDLSGGNQQKGRDRAAASSRRRRVLMDEPTRGVDIGAKCADLPN
jgi:ABC-type sugar transport system ATPase subunit